MTNFRAQDMPGSPQPVATAPVEAEPEAPVVEPEAPVVEDETPEPASEQEAETLAEASEAPTIKRSRSRK